jgi:DNA-binding transcriptional LysR family regulator
MNASSLSWEDTQTFLAVVEHRSFSAAARALALGQPTVSRRIQHLERLLAQQLFVRGKHGARPTDAALRLVPAAEQMAKWAAEFDRAASGAERLASGVVRVAAPPGVAVEQLAPFAALLRQRAPAISLEVLSAIDHIDLTRGHADLAIRTHYPNEPELVVLREFETQPGVYASRSYAESIRQPCTWEDLAWVTWAGRYRDVAPRSMLEKVIPGFEPVFASDDYLVQKAAVTAGLGATIISRPAGFEQGELVEIDVGVRLPAQSLYVVCAKSMQHVPRVRAVFEFLVESIEGAAVA